MGLVHITSWYYYRKRGSAYVRCAWLEREREREREKEIQRERERDTERETNGK